MKSLWEQVNQIVVFILGLYKVITVEAYTFISSMTI